MVTCKALSGHDWGRKGKVVVGRRYWSCSQDRHLMVSIDRTSLLLNTIPQELIDAIVEVVHIDDILSLALTCSYFFRLLAPRVQSVLKKDSAPWVGDRLVILGSYFDNEPDDGSFGCEAIRDIEAILADERKTRTFDKLGERTHFYASSSPSDEYDEVLSGSSSNARSPDASLLKDDPPLAIVGVHRDARRTDLQQRIKACSAGESDELQRASRLLNILMQEVDKTRYLRDPTQSFHCSKCRQKASRSAFQDAQVLRNLTAKQYVRQDALGEDDGYYTLASFIFRHAHWTDVQPGEYKDPDDHGCWAGHRFDVAMLEDVRGEEWRDVTEMLVYEIQVVCDETGYDNRRFLLEEEADGARIFANERWEEERQL